MSLDESTIPMINPTGRVVYVPSYRKKELEKQGFHVIINAKEEYYPQYDKNNQGWQDGNVIENLSEDEYLDVERI